MSYAVELSDEALDTLSRLPIDVVVAISNQLEVLAQSPTTLSKRANFPHRVTDGQIYEFWCDAYFIKIFFRYHSNETTLDIYAIGYVRYSSQRPDR